MEKMHAVPTPLAAVMKKDPVENNNMEHHRRRRSFEEEAQEQPPLDDSMVCTNRLYHSLENTNAYTNPGKTRAAKDTNENRSNVSISPCSLLTKTNLKQHRGRQRSGSESCKKVSFDEESLRSTSSQYSRSDSELWPQKLPHRTRYQKKRTSSQTSVESPLAVRSHVTTSPRNPQTSVDSPLAVRSHTTTSPRNPQTSADSPLAVKSHVTTSSRNPYQVKQEIKKHLVTKDLNSSLDEGFSDTFEMNVAKRNGGRSMSFTHSSKSDSLDGSMQIYDTKEKDIVPRNPFLQKTSSLDRNIYHYSSSESEDSSSPTKLMDKEVDPRSNFTRQVGRRGRKAQDAYNPKPVSARKDNSEFVIQELEMEPGSRSQRQGISSPRSLGKNYRVASMEEPRERVAFSDESFSNHSHSSNYMNNEAILLEKYIIRKPKSESSSSAVDQEILDDSIIQDDSIIHSNLRSRPDELALQDSFEYYGFAAGPQSTSSTDNILNEKESTNEQCPSPVDPKISIKEIPKTLPEKTISFDTAEQTLEPVGKISNTYSGKAASVGVEPLKEEPGENAEKLRSDARNTNDALTNSTASILSLSSEEGSVTVNDFLQDYDQEPFVRRARSMTLGHENRTSAGISSLESKKVRFCSEDNLVYELRYGFSDEDRPSESPEKLDLSFIDDIQSDDQLSDSGVAPNTPSLPRFFRDSDGSSSSCTPDASPRLPQDVDPAEQSTSHRSLLRRSLQMPSEKDTVIDGEQTSGIDDAMTEDWSAVDDVNLKEQKEDTKDTIVENTLRGKDFSEIDREPKESFNFDIPVSSQSPGVSYDASDGRQTPPLSKINRDGEMVVNEESKIEYNEKREVGSGELNALTPIQPWKKSEIKAGSHVRRNLFMGSGDLKTQSPNTSGNKKSESKSEEAIDRETVLVNASINSDDRIGKVGPKLIHSKEQNFRTATKEVGDQNISSVPLTTSLQSSIQVPSIDTQSKMVPIAIPSSSSTLFVSSTIQSHDNLLSEEVSIVTTSVAVTTQTPSGISVQSNDLNSNKTSTHVKVPIATAVIASSAISTSVQSPGNSSLHNSSEEVAITKSLETPRAPAFVAFRSTPVDEPYIAKDLCVHDKTTSTEITTQGIAISTKHYSNSGNTTLITTSSVVSSSSSSSFINSAPITSAFSQSAFSDWNWKPTPVKPLTFVPPKAKTSLSNTSPSFMPPTAKTTLSNSAPSLVEGKKSASQTPGGDLSHLKLQHRLASSTRGSDGQGGKQATSKDSYNSTAEWVLSHSNRFVFRSGEKQSNEEVNSKSLTTAAKKEDREIPGRINPEKDGDSQTIQKQIQFPCDGKQVKLSSPINRENMKLCENSGKPLEREEGSKGDAIDGEMKVDQDEKQNKNSKIDSKKKDIDNEKQETKSVLPQLQEKEQGKSFQSDINKVNASLTSALPTNFSLQFQGPIDNAAIGIKDIESNSNTSPGDMGEPYGYYRDVNRPLWKHPSELIFARQYRDFPMKKKVYIDGSLQRSRKPEAKTDKLKPEAKTDRQDSGKVTEQGMDLASDDDNGRGEEDSSSPLISNHSERVIISTQVVNTTGATEEQNAVKGLQDKDSEASGIVDIAAARDVQNTDNSMASIRGKEGKPITDDVNVYNGPPLCDSENSDLGDIVTKKKSADQPKNNVVMRNKSGVRRQGSQSEHHPEREVPSMLPRTLSAKRLSALIPRPESPEAVHILSEIFLAILIFLVSMLFLFY
jgi:hypothetical protein